MPTTATAASCTLAQIDAAVRLVVAHGWGEVRIVIVSHAIHTVAPTLVFKHETDIDTWLKACYGFGG